MELKKAEELLKKGFEDCELMELYLENKKLIGLFEDCSATKYTDNEEIIKQNNLEVFHLRQGDESCDPETIEKRVICNRFGIFILEKGELILPNKSLSDTPDYYENIKDHNFI